MKEVLAVSDLVADYGSIRALGGVTITVRSGESVALLGPNGAGKSTLLRAISGLHKPSSGSITFCGTNIAGFARHPERIARLGIAHVPEGRRVIPGLTVRENLELAANAAHDRPTRYSIKDALRSFPVLADRADQRGWSLSGGEQQMVAVARAMLSQPVLLMLDEPSLGLAPQPAQEVFNVVSLLAESGTTILLVEQNARAALRIATRAYVLENGAIALQGSANELIRDERIKQIYLGAAG